MPTFPWVICSRHLEKVLKRQCIAACSCGPESECELSFQVQSSLSFLCDDELASLSLVEVRSSPGHALRLQSSSEFHQCPQTQLFSFHVDESASCPPPEVRHFNLSLPSSEEVSWEFAWDSRRSAGRFLGWNQGHVCVHPRCTHNSSYSFLAAVLQLSFVLTVLKFRHGASPIQTT